MRKVHVKKGKGFDGLEKILKNHVKLLDRYSKFSDEDHAFFYTEMSNVGIFASAASLAGWSALCEPQHSKKSKKDGRKKSDGRADLYLINEDDSQEYMCEAKLGVVGCATARENWSRSFEPKMDEAKEDTKRCTSGKLNGLALSFFTMAMKKKSISELEVRQKQIVDFLKSWDRPSAFLAYFLNNPDDVGYENSLLIGSILIVEEVKG